MRFYSLYITNKCNMDCLYCYRKKYEQLNYDEEIIISELSKWIENENEDIRIEFLGGEPLLDIEKIHNICSHINNKFYDKNISYMTTTNGTIVSNRIIDVLNEFNIKLIISVDGLKNLHDRHRQFKDKSKTYDIICNNFDSVFYKFKPTIHITVTSDTIPYILESFKHAHERFGSKEITIGFVNGSINDASLELFRVISKDIIDYSVENDIFIAGIMNDCSSRAYKNKSYIIDVSEDKTELTKYDLIVKDIRKYYNEIKEKR